MNEKEYFIFFSNLNGIGPKTFLYLLTYFKSAENIYNASEKELVKTGLIGKKLETFLKAKKEFDIPTYLEKIKKAKVEYIPYGDKFYPESLKKTDSAPIGLFIKGNKKLLLEKNNIAIVGARKITSYGRDVTKLITQQLVQNNLVITSGLALGVDGVAHGAVLEEKGFTIAVLGCGVDCPYPRENEKLYENILDNKGLIISEYPLGMSASPGTFPARNRIIAALSLAVLVTEAAEDSGSLITADYALKYKRKLFAVPGPINSSMSRGALKLLKEGATLVSSGEDIINELNIKLKTKNLKNKMKNLKLNKDEKAVCDALENEELRIDQICRITKLSINKLLSVTSELEIRGIIKNDGGKMFLVS